MCVNKCVCKCTNMKNTRYSEAVFILELIYLPTHNAPTDDVENTNGTNYGEDLRLIDKPQNLPRGTERIP